MDERLLVCKEFIERHPEAAARALFSLPGQQVVALLEELPAAVSALVLGRAGAMRSARLLPAMESTAAADILAGLPADQAAAVIRLLEPRLRNELLARQKLQFRRQLAESLEYPADSIGAIMTTTITVLDETSRVSDALAALRDTGQAGLQYVFVTDRRHRVAGIIPALTLLCSPAKTRLSELVDVRPPVLLSRASIATAAELECWKTTSILPVCNRDRQLVGAVPHATLRRWQVDARALPETPASSIVLSMSGDLIDSVSGLWSLMTDTSPGNARFRANRQ